MKEKYRLMLQGMLEDMQRRERINRSICRMAENVARMFRAFGVRMDDLGRLFRNLIEQMDYFAQVAAFEQEIKTEEQSYPTPTIEEAFAALQELATEKEKTLRLGLPKGYQKIPPRRIAPRNVNCMAHDARNRHRARDMLPN